MTWGDPQWFALGVGARALAGLLLTVLAVRGWRADNGDLRAWRGVVTAWAVMAAWHGVGDLEAATNFWPGGSLRLLTLQGVGLPWLGVAATVGHLLWRRR